MWKKHKYGVAPKAERTYKGRVFHSKGEMRYFQKLELMEKAGEIRHLTTQPGFRLVWGGMEPVKIPDKNGRRRQVTVHADFKFYDVREKRVRYLDFKGKDTYLSRLQRALVYSFHGVEIEIVKGR